MYRFRQVDQNCFLAFLLYAWPVVCYGLSWTDSKISERRPRHGGLILHISIPYFFIMYMDPAVETPLSCAVVKFDVIFPCCKVSIEDRLMLVLHM